MTLHPTKIGDVQVPVFQCVVSGTRWGYVSTHYTTRAALRSLAEEVRSRLRSGDPSDAEAYRWRDGGWEPVGVGVNVELVVLPDAPPA